MSSTRTILASAFLAILLLGCKKAETPPAPTLNGSTGSVAAPESAMPPSDAKIPGTAPGPATGSGDASAPTQASPEKLSEEQESSSMPLPGQANDHSTPAMPGEKK